MSKNFFHKEKEYTQQLASRRAKLKAELTAAERRARERRRFDRATGKVVVVHEGGARGVVWNDETRAAFFERMEAGLQRREEALGRLDTELYSSLGRLTIDRKRGEGEEDEDDPVAAFLKRVDDDIEERRASQPHKFKERMQADPLAEGKPSWLPT